MIPKLRLRPDSGRTKAEIIDSAGLIDESQDEKRLKYAGNSASGKPGT